MKVLIADDHPMVRDALARTVHAIEPEAQILQAKDYAEIEHNLQTPPDLVLVDLTMPGMDGVEGIRRLRAAHPNLRMVVASGDDDPATIRSVLATGVSGFLPKTEVADVFMHAIEIVLSGGTYAPAQALVGLCDAPAPQRAGAGGLTARQMDVLRLLMQGQPNKVIARDLEMSEGRVKNVMAEIFRVLQVCNRTGAANAARKLGILS